MWQHFSGNQLLERGPLALAISRLCDGMLLHANEAFFRLTGYSREETVGSTASSLPLWCDAGARARMVEALRRSGYKYNLLIDLRRKSGEVVQVLGNAQTIEVEGEPHILTMLNDLRDLDEAFSAQAARRAQLGFVEAQREQQMRLQAQVMKNMAEGVMTVSAASGTILSTNPRFDSLLGYAPGQLVGQPVSVINATSDGDPQAVADAIMEELRLRGEWRGELKNRRADGREIWISATVSEMVHEGLGKVWVAVHTDINDRRLAQDARDEAFARLRLLSLNIQDSIEAERLAVSRDVHDQLGAALTGMRMKLEALAGGIPQGAPVAAAELLALADTARATQLAARAICTRLRPQLLDDLGLLEACRWYLQDWSAQVGIAARGHFARAGALPDDRLATDMFRVMQELLTNVARHAGASLVQVALCGGRTGFTLRVRDDGHGFAPNQAHSGFGLLGVQERVRQHNGRFQLQSDASGSTVTVTLQNAVAP